MSLVPVDTSNEVAVIAYLENGVAALSGALERTDVIGIANMKAEAATVETATKQLSLSKESQDFATELVRRSEWTMGQAVKKAQAEGLIRPHGASLIPGARTGGQATTSSSLPSPKTFFGSQTEYEDVNAIAKATPEELDAILREATEEGNATRTNVARKVREIKTPGPARSPELRQQRADVIADLASQGYSSSQMASRVGVIAETVRRIAREHNIEIPADKAIGRQRRIDHTAAMESTVTALENWASALHDLDFAEVDFKAADEWVASLSQSASELRRFINKIKETTHV